MEFERIWLEWQPSKYRALLLRRERQTFEFARIESWQPTVADSFELGVITFSGSRPPLRDVSAQAKHMFVDRKLG